MKISKELANLSVKAEELEAKVAEYERRYSAPLTPFDALPDVVRETRQSQGLTQRALADLAEVSQATVVGIETKSRTPQLDGLNRILSALGLTLYVGGH